MEFIARTVPLEDPAFRAFQYAVTFPGEVPADKLDYYWNTIKVPGMVPHDLGSPRKRPWTILNAFDWQNGNVWKDLNPKLPLRAYRDFLAGGGLDMGFLMKMFEASVLAPGHARAEVRRPGVPRPSQRGHPRSDLRYVEDERGERLRRAALAGRPQGDHPHGRDALFRGSWPA
jgi:uncharacterized protein (DUF608 family)